MDFGDHKGAERAQPSILLCNAGYYGTLAAIRSLGRAGIPVISIDPSSLSAGSYSRYCTSHLRSPPFEETTRFAQWLLDAGKPFAGSVLYATSDAVSYALAKYRQDLEKLFLLYQPDLETMMCVLDKGQLLRHAQATGIDTPPTWLPTSRANAQEIANAISERLIIKPRCQLAARNLVKGTVLKPGPDALMQQFDRMAAVGPGDPSFAKSHPEIMFPMFQAFYPEAVNSVYSLSGFRDRSGTKTAVLAAVKSMQRPHNLGIGLCFEEAPVDTALAGKVMELCERIGYYGAFECEFIQAGDKKLLIDFNARFYNQVGLEIARGLDIPGLVYAAATGQDEKVDDLIAAFEKREKGQNYAFCNSFQFQLITRFRRGLGSMSPEESGRWTAWRQSSKNIVEAAFDQNDLIPYAIDSTQQIFSILRRPRAFFRDCLTK